MSAIAKRPDAYEHVPPDSVGNGTRFVVSELAGKSTLTLKAKELGLSLDGPQLNDLVDTLKRMEHDGYHFEVADASLELLMRRATGWEQRWFEVESFRVITDDDDPFSAPTVARGVTTEATIKVHVDGERRDRDRRGQRPGQRARHRAAQRARRPVSRRSRRCTSPTTRCGCSTPPGAPARSPGCSSTPPTATARWTTIGVSENIIEASWQALYDSLVYGLLARLARRDRRAVALTHAHRSVRRPRARRPPAPGAEPRARGAPARGQRVEGRPSRRPRRRAAQRRPPRSSRAQRRVRGHARRPPARLARSSRRTSTSPTRSRWSPSWR